MTRVTQHAEESNAIPTADSNFTASTKSTFNESASAKSGEKEEKEQLEAADKCNAKIHYFSRTIAKEHGIIPATLLSGFAYKLKFHRLNQWNSRFWYYDSVETLRTRRWPYLSDGCLSENTKYLQEKQLLIKDCNNKQSYDRTVWYAMDDEVREKALSDLIWFDVHVARKLGNILPGAIYHNLRYQVRKVLDQDPDCPAPYHRFNQALLARALCVDVATIKRWVKALREKGLILRHPSKPRLYTLADEREYRSIGASANANDASANGAKVNENDASANANGAKANANGAKVNDNTQYEADKKPVGNQSRKGGYVSDDEFFSGHKFPYADHKEVSDAVNSVPRSGKEGTDAEQVGESNLSIHWNKFKTFEQLVQCNQQTKASWHLLGEETKMSIDNIGAGFALSFAQAVISAGFVEQIWDVKNRDQLLKALRQPFAEYVTGEMLECKDHALDSDQITDLVFAPHFETLIRAFAAEEVWARQTFHTMEEHKGEIRETYLALLDTLESETSFSSAIKVRIFKQAVVLKNRYGWPFGDKAWKKNLVQPAAAGFRAVEALFKGHPELSVDHLLGVLEKCQKIIHLEDEPEGFDKHWAARQGGNLVKFARILEKIVLELDMFAQCPIGASV